LSGLQRPIADVVEHLRLLKREDVLSMKAASWMDFGCDRMKFIIRMTLKIGTAPGRTNDQIESINPSL
jgi:hypothetical protein